MLRTIGADPVVEATRVYLVLAWLTLRRWLWWHVPGYAGRVETHDKRASAEDVRNARQAAMSQTTQQWQERVHEMQQQITILRGRVDVSQAAAHQLTPTSVFDTRVLGKPDCFDGSSRWKDWSIVFRSYASACSPSLGVLMERAENATCLNVSTESSTTDNPQFSSSTCS